MRKWGDRVNEAKIMEVVTKFAEEAKKIYGTKLKEIILYGSCARGDYKSDSDVDIMVLLNVPREKINTERNLIYDISDKLDLEYDVVLTPVFQNYDFFQKYMSASVFYQNIQREGKKIA